MSLAKFILISLLDVFFCISYANSGEDTLIIRDYIKKADRLCSIYPDSALLYSQKALNTVSLIDDPYLVSKIFETHGIVFYHKARYDSSTYYLKLSIKHIPKKESSYLATLYNLYGSALIMHNEFDTALYYIQNSFDINTKLELKKGLMNNYANFGLVYKCMGAYDVSISYIYKGLPIAEELRDTLTIIKLLHSIGSNYRSMGKPKLGIIYCKKALDYSLAIHNYKRASELANTIANFYKDLAQYDEAMRNYQLSYDYAHKIDYPTMEAAALVNIGLYYAIDNRFDSAMYYLAKGYHIAQNNNYISIIAAADITYGKIYTEAKQYDKALQHLLNVIDSENKAENSFIDKAYLQLSVLYEAMGDYAQAYKYHVIYSQRSDSTLNKQKAEEIANIRMQYELNKKQEQMDAQLKAETHHYRLIRNITIAGFLVVLVIAVLVIISYRSMQKQKLVSLKNEINSYRQRLMTQQINPHFIFNTLNSIQYFIYNNKKEESMDFVSRFAQLMRLNLYNSQNEIIALQDEIEALKLYLELERIRLDNKFDYTIDIDPAIDIKTQLVPSFLIQPIVENSIKHGILKNGHKGNILTRIIQDKGSLIYSIIDNGIGFEKSKASQKGTKHTSYGLELTKKRISLIGILNSKQTGFTFADIKEKNGECIGTKVELVIPSSLKSM